MCVCLPVCMHCVTYMPDAHGGKKRELDPLELELQIILSQHVRGGNQTQVSCKSNKFP